MLLKEFMASYILTSQSITPGSLGIILLVLYLHVKIYIGMQKKKKAIGSNNYIIQLV